MKNYIEKHSLLVGGVILTLCGLARLLTISPLEQNPYKLMHIAASVCIATGLFLIVNDFLEKRPILAIQAWAKQNFTIKNLMESVMVMGCGAILCAIVYFYQTEGTKFFARGLVIGLLGYTAWDYSKASGMLLRAWIKLCHVVGRIFAFAFIFGGGATLGLSIFGVDVEGFFTMATVFGGVIVSIIMAAAGIILNWITKKLFKWRPIFAAFLLVMAFGFSAQAQTSVDSVNLMQKQKYQKVMKRLYMVRVGEVNHYIVKNISTDRKSSSKHVTPQGDTITIGANWRLAGSSMQVNGVFALMRIEDTNHSFEMRISSDVFHKTAFSWTDKKSDISLSFLPELGEEMEKFADVKEATFTRVRRKRAPNSNRFSGMERIPRTFKVHEILLCDYTSKVELSYLNQYGMVMFKLSRNKETAALLLTVPSLREEPIPMTRVSWNKLGFIKNPRRFEMEFKYNQ